MMFVVCEMTSRTRCGASDSTRALVGLIQKREVWQSITRRSPLIRNLVFVVKMANNNILQLGCKL